MEDRGQKIVDEICRLEHGYNEWRLQYREQNTEYREQCIDYKEYSMEKV